MKIVYLYPQVAERAGTERIFSDKMNWLAEQKDYEIVLLTYEQCNRPFAFSLSPKIRHVDLDVRYYPYYRYNFPYRLFKWHQLDKILQKRFDAFMSEIHPDIIIATTSYVKPLSLVCHSKFRCVRLLESHIDRRYIMSNNPLNQVSLWKRFLGSVDMWNLTHYAREFDLLVALNQKDANDWAKFLKTIVITNMVHLNPYNHVSSLKNKDVIFAGRYTLQKGIPDLLNIWQIVYARHSDWHLHLYGEGEMEGDILKMVGQLDANIHVHKSADDIFSRYIESSIFVLSSLYEPFGLVIPEAMSCGLPVVAFDCPEGPAQIIHDGIDGFLVQNRNVSIFADRICSLIESEELRLKMGKAAILSSERFSPSLIMPLWVNLFRNLMKRLS